MNRSRPAVGSGTTVTLREGLSGTSGSSKYVAAVMSSVVNVPDGVMIRLVNSPFSLLSRSSNWRLKSTTSNASGDPGGPEQFGGWSLGGQLGIICNTERPGAVFRTGGDQRCSSCGKPRKRKNRQCQAQDPEPFRTTREARENLHLGRLAFSQDESTGSIHTVDRWGRVLCAASLFPSRDLEVLLAGGRFRVAKLFPRCPGLFDDLTHSRGRTADRDPLGGWSQAFFRRWDFCAAGKETF